MTSATSNAVNSAPTGPVPIIWYKFDTGDFVGSTIYNSATGLYDATMSTAVTATTSNPSPAVGTGCFNANSATYITLNNSVIATNAAASAAGWSSTGWTPLSSLGYTICMWYYYNNPGYLFDFSTTGQFTRILLGPGSSINWGASYGGTMGGNGSAGWHHVAFVIPANVTSSSTASLYIDGTLNATINNPTPGSTYSKYSPNYICRINQGNDGTNSFPGVAPPAIYPGAIDDFRIYAVVLTSTQISNIYNKTL